MIPIVNKATDGDYPTNWCNYDEKQWCNAVTVKSEYLITAQDADVGTVIPEDQILGYWVYIPRYAYRVQRLAAWHKPIPFQTPFDIRFEKFDTPKKTPSMGSNTTAGSDAIGRCTTAPTIEVPELSTAGVNYQTECDVSDAYPTVAPYDQSQWATHPAFSFDKNNNGDYDDPGEELNGLWIGKFETGTDFYCQTGAATKPVSCGESIAPSTDAGGIVIKPNKSPLTFKYIGVMFGIAKIMSPNFASVTGGRISLAVNNTMNLSSSSITKMIKNSEWGAAAYLSTSQYGVGDEACTDIECTNYKKVYNNGYINGTVNSNQLCTVTPATDDTATTSLGCRFVTGAGPGDDKADINSTNLHQYHTTIGQQASTTGNIYGIYDMAGGAWEAVMGNYVSAYNQSYSNCDSSYVLGEPIGANYRDIYLDADFNTNGSNKLAWMTSTDVDYNNFDFCTFATCGGQANYEVTSVQSVSNYIDQGWNSDHTLFSDFSCRQWFWRGGTAQSNHNTGLFSSYSQQGIYANNAGFRVSLSTF
jgi:hypothetical protein